MFQAVGTPSLMHTAHNEKNVGFFWLCNLGRVGRN